MSKFFARFRKDEKGATAIEYGLIAALISVGIIGAATTLQEEISGTFGRIGTALENAGTSAPAPAPAPGSGPT